MAATLAATVRQRKAANLPPSPETVTAVAALCFQTEAGIPVTPAPHHWLWLRLACDMNIKKLLIIGTPESAKTTWLLAWAATMIGFYPDWPGIVATVSGAVAETRSQALQNVVNSAGFRQLFPDVSRAAGMAQRSDEWSLATDGQPHPGRVHATVRSYGTGGRIIGGRARWVLADDLLDHENTRTAHQRETVNTWLHNSLLSRVMARVGIVRVVGNAWHHDDSHARIRQSEGWVTCHIPLLSETADVYATVTYPDDFAGERLGEPVAGGRL